MDAEHESQTVHGVDQRLHAFPAARFDAGRQIVGMVVVVAWFCPAIQMQVHLSDTELIEVFDLLLSGGKGGENVVFLRIFWIIKVGLWIDMSLDAAMDKGAADQVVDRRNAGSFFLQRGEQTVFLDVVAVDLAQVVVIAVSKEGVFQAAAIIHFAKAWFPPAAHMGVWSTRWMLRIDAAVPWSRSDGDIACAVFDLTKPRHIAAGGEELTVEGQLSKLNRPVVWNKQSLTVVEQGVILFGSFLKFHIAWPSHLLNGKVLFADRNPFKVDGAVDLLHPDKGVEGVGIGFAQIVAVGGVDALADAAAKLGVTDFLPAGERHDAYFGLHTGAIVIAPSPCFSLCFDLILQCSFVQSQDDFSHRYFHFKFPPAVV